MLICTYTCSVCVCVEEKEKKRKEKRGERGGGRRRRKRKQKKTKGRSRGSVWCRGHRVDTYYNTQNKRHTKKTHLFASCCWLLLLLTNPRTEAEPQQIVAQRLLSCLQYHVPIKSSTEDLTRPTFRVAVKYRADQSYWYSNTGQGEYRRCQHGF